MLQAGEGEAVLRRHAAVLAVQQTVEHAGGESIASADPVNDPGELYLLCLEALLARVDSGRKTVVIAIHSVPGGRCDSFQGRESFEGGKRCFSAAALTFATEFTAEQKRNVAIVAEQDVALANEFQKDRLGIAIPLLP